MHGWMSGWDWALDELRDDLLARCRCGDGPCRREAGEPGADRSTEVVRELLFIALILACPLMMIWMMRGHGQGGHAHGHAVGSGHGPGDTSSEKSTAELRRQHDELDRLIGERESE